MTMNKNINSRKIAPDSSVKFEGVIRVIRVIRGFHILF